MPKKQPPQDIEPEDDGIAMNPHQEPELGDIPELDDIVEPGPHAEPGATPPPNLDLFGEEIDLDALREQLTARLHDEIDVVVAELHVALEETVRRHFDVRLRERLPGILDELFPADRPQDDEDDD